VDVGDRVHRECPGARQPELVAGSGVQRQQHVGVACGPVTEAWSFAKRTGSPRQLATAEQQRIGPRIRRQRGKRDVHSGSAVAPCTECFHATP